MQQRLRRADFNFLVTVQLKKRWTNFFQTTHLQFVIQSFC